MLVILPKQVPTSGSCARTPISALRSGSAGPRSTRGACGLLSLKTAAAILRLPQSTQGFPGSSPEPQGLSAGGSACCPGQEWSRRWSGRRGQGRGADGGRPPLPRVPAGPRGCAGRPNIIQHPASALAPGAGASRPPFGCFGPV